MTSNAVRVDIDWARLNRRLTGNVDAAQKVLDLAVLKDSTPYVPRDTGNLANSGIRGTRIGTGEVVWDAPYAARQYYSCPNKAHDVHPNATVYWFEAAKAVMGKAWLRAAKKMGGR